MISDNIQNSSQPIPPVGVVRSVPYRNHQARFPLVAVKHYHGVCINDPKYWPDPEPGEIFLMVDDRVKNNIVAERYMASNKGRVFDRSLNKYINPCGNALKKADGSDNSYYKVQLSYYKTPDTLVSSYQYVHRIVNLMHNYVPYSENREFSELESEHINGDHSCNRAENLHWVTHNENMNKAYCSGEMTNGNLIKNNLPPHHINQPINQILIYIDAGLSNREIANKTGCSMGQIRDIRNGKTYKDYVAQYKAAKENNINNQ